MTARVPITGASMTVTPEKVTVRATIGWNGSGVQQGLTVGNVRVIAFDAESKLPTVIFAPDAYAISTGGPTSYTYEMPNPPSSVLHALAAGNRVVITATQHQPVFPTAYVSLSYVTVFQLQPSDARANLKPAGTKDCSDEPVTASGDYNFCDLAGAVLDKMNLQNASMVLANLSGATLTNANLSGVTFDGSVMAGVDMSLSYFAGGTAKRVDAPGLRDVGITRNKFGQALETDFIGANLARADFSQSYINGTTFVRSDLDGSKFDGSTLEADQFDFASMRRTVLEPAKSTATPFILVNWTNATVVTTNITEQPEDRYPPGLLSTVTLCHTMVNGEERNRDCP